MARPTRIHIDTNALLHNLDCIRKRAPGKQIAAMVKANAYGCGLNHIIPALEGKVDFFGVASLEEALAIRALQAQTPCILFQGVFSPAELTGLAENNISVVVHTFEQLQWLQNTSLSKAIKVWIKVNTGMHRLGFSVSEIPAVMDSLKNCPQVQKNWGLITHFSCADHPENPATLAQLELFQTIDWSLFNPISIANSAAIMYFPQIPQDMVRPGIMLYGISPAAEKCGQDYDLLPVMHFVSRLSAVKTYAPPVAVGYGGTWVSDKPAVIGIIPAGYGDGYPRHVSSEAYVWINGYKAPLAGRVSMDMLAVDLTDIPDVKTGDSVELWGAHLPVEEVARWAGTIAYELICQITPRVREPMIKSL